MRKAYDPVRREVLYNIFTEFGVPMKLKRIVKSAYVNICVIIFLSKVV
jgi:hypothetical protein